MQPEILLSPVKVKDKAVISEKVAKMMKDVGGRNEENDDEDQYEEPYFEEEEEEDDDDLNLIMSAAPAVGCKALKQMGFGRKGSSTKKK